MLPSTRPEKSQPPTEAPSADLANQQNEIRPNEVVDLPQRSPYHRTPGWIGFDPTGDL
jgi:hypothetical protein